MLCWGPILKDLRCFLEMLLLKLLWMMSWYCISMWNRPELAARHPIIFRIQAVVNIMGARRLTGPDWNTFLQWLHGETQSEGRRDPELRTRGPKVAVKQWQPHLERSAGDTHLPSTWWGGKPRGERSVPSRTTPFPLSSSKDQFPLFCFWGGKEGVGKKKRCTQGRQEKVYSGGLSNNLKPKHTLPWRIHFLLTPTPDLQERTVVLFSWVLQPRFLPLN